MSALSLVAPERTRPHNLEAEVAVLGAILLHPERLADLTEPLTPAHFYRSAHQTIYAAILAVSATSSEVDYLTVKEYLTTQGALERIGGAAYIAALVDGVPRSLNVVAYAQILREKAYLRAAIDAAYAILEDAYAASDNARSVLDRAEQRMFAIAEGQPGAGLTSIADILPGVMDQIQGWCDTRTGMSGIPSGFTDLDHQTRGFQRGNLVIIGARPSMGKSAFALNLAQHACGLGKTVGFFSLEMSDEELVTRAIVNQARLDGHQLQRGRVQQSEWSRLSEAYAALGAMKLFIDQSPFVTVFDMRARARRLKAQHGLDLVIVDYTQLMIGHEKKENRNLEVSAITRALKGLAKDLHVPVIALSQLSRDLERRQDKRPMLADLRDSGSIEQDADVVLFLYRDEVYHDATPDRGIAEVIIGKQRNGPIGTVKLAWRAEQMRFENLTARPSPRTPLSTRD